MPKILLAYDGSEGARQALTLALDLARALGAELTALAVADKRPAFSATLDETQEALEFAQEHYGRLLVQAQEEAAKAGLTMATLLRAGHPAKVIVETAKEGGFDLLVLGHTGLSGVWALMGSTAEKVSRHAPCSVVIAR